MTRRLILSFDGTWSTPENTESGDLAATNVVKLHHLIPQIQGGSNIQIPKYFKGIGTNWHDRFRGGAFGFGLDRIIRDGYKFLIRRYEPGDEIFIFGYSRGAYTARSLVGLIRNAGLIDRTNFENNRQLNKLVDEAYELYRTRDEGPDTEAAQMFRAAHALEIRIKFLGVWDTVGALGIPVNSFGWFNRRFFEFHDTQLSSIVENAYHAIAIDEHRESFKATLWNAPTVDTQHMEQKWFVGSHGNIGGGYADSRLSDITLQWMQQKASECGLQIAQVATTAEAYLGTLRNSFDEWPATFRFLYPDRYYREIGATGHPSESLHETTEFRMEADETYRPPNVIQYLDSL